MRSAWNESAVSPSARDLPSPKQTVLARQRSVVTPGQMPVVFGPMGAELPLTTLLVSCVPGTLVKIPPPLLDALPITFSFVSTAMPLVMEIARHARCRCRPPRWRRRLRPSCPGRARIIPMSDAQHYRHYASFLNPSLAERFD